jgi:hypothetical protein
MNLAWVWLLWSEPWRGHLAPLASPAVRVSPRLGWLAAARDRDDVALTRSWPGRCGIVPVAAARPVLPHRGGGDRRGRCGGRGARGAAATRRCPGRSATHSRRATPTWHPCRTTWYGWCCGYGSAPWHLGRSPRHRQVRGIASGPRPRGGGRDRSGPADCGNQPADDRIYAERAGLPAPAHRPRAPKVASARVPRRISVGK